MSISLAPALLAQGSSGLAAPTALERENARAELGDKVLPLYRKALKEGAAPALLVDALMELGRRREQVDIGLIARHVSSLDPHVSGAAVDALKVYGRAGLKAVQALDAKVIDAQTRKQALELLLLDHVKNCCRRDQAVNPYHFAFESRIDELYSVDQPIDDLLLKLLRDALPDIRADIDGTRYYYYGGYQTRNEQPFIDYGGLAVAALAKRKPDALQREFGDLARVNQDDNQWYGWGNQRSSVTLELACFFAQRGQTALVDKLINDIQSMLRWQQANWGAPYHVQIAVLQHVALGEHNAALERLNAAIATMGLDPDPNVAFAHYLRARILLTLGEEGEALHAIEESMEAADQPPLLILVDAAFDGLRSERRFINVQRLCELRERVVPAGARPWRKGEPEPEPEPEPDPDTVNEDE